MAPGKWDALWEKGVRHMRFAVKLYRLQAEAGRLFLHEHPNSASIWKLQEVMTRMSDLGTTKSVAHLCRYGMTSKDGEGVGCVKKPTGSLTNSIHLKDQLQKTCMGGHRHVQLVGGRAKPCQIYPRRLCRAMLRGIRNELVQSGIIAGNLNDMLTVSEENWNGNEYLEEYIDDMSGQHLGRDLVRADRKEEMDKLSEHKVYTKRPIVECVKATGK